MATTVIPTQLAQKKTDEICVLPLDEVAETIRDDALEIANERLSAPFKGLELKRLLRRPDYVDNFKYGLALGVANMLSANDPQVQAVFLYEPSDNPDSELGSDLPVEGTVHILVVVKSPSAALKALIASLDRALTASLMSLPSPAFAERESLLDANLLTQADIEQGRGYALLLSSMFAPPIRVWQR